MFRRYYFKDMKVLWIFKAVGFSYDKKVTTNPPKLLEKATYGFRICLFKKGFGLHRNYKAFIYNFERLKYKDGFSNV